MVPSGIASPIALRVAESEEEGDEAAPIVADYGEMIDGQGGGGREAEREAEAAGEAGDGQPRRHVVGG